MNMVIGIVVLIILCIACVVANSNDKTAKKIAENRKCYEHQKEVAHMSPKDKRETCVKDFYHSQMEYLEHVSNVYRKNAYAFEEKEHDWAVLGGIANGIAGPAAGVITAMDAISDNERIRESNAAVRSNIDNLVTQAEIAKATLRPDYSSIQGLGELYFMSPVDLFNKYFEVMSVKTKYLEGLYLNVELQIKLSAGISLKDPLYIDGALRAKVYTTNKGGDRLCIGCAYLILSVDGGLSLSHDYQYTLSGIASIKSHVALENIKIEVEPVDLYITTTYRKYLEDEKYVAKILGINEKAKILTYEQHMSVVHELEEKFDEEVRSATRQLKK